MGIKPLKDRVLLKPFKQPERTSGGIYLPESATEKQQEAVVVAIGTDKKNIHVKVGDKVLYEKFGGTEIEIGTEKHLLVKSADILAIIT